MKSRGPAFRLNADGCEEEFEQLRTYGAKVESDDGLSDSQAREQVRRPVLQLVAEGMSTKQIALELHVSTKTIEANRRQIMEKLDVHSVAELTKCAVREGLTTLEP